MSDRQPVWTLDTFLPFRGSLRGNCKTDAAVIGGGMAGILTAHFLQQRGMRTVVLEAGRIGHGQTSRTTARITSQHGLIYDRLIRDYGVELAQQYANAQQQAIELYRQMAVCGQISCDLQDAPSYLYTTCRGKALERELRAAEKLWIPAKLEEGTELPFPVAGALRFANQAQFHPLRFLQAVAAPLTVFENTPAKAIEGDLIYTENGIVQADYIVITTRFPFVNVPGGYYLRMAQERGYVLALRRAQRLTGMYQGIDPGGYAFRSAGEVLLFSGGNDRCGDVAVPSRYGTLRGAAKAVFPGSVEIRSWGGQDCVTIDGLPYVGLYSPRTPGLYVAAGFGRWGMTNAMAAAVLLSDTLLGKRNDCAGIFSPQRFSFRAAVRGVFREKGRWVRGLTRSFSHAPKSRLDKVENGHGALIRYKHKLVGVYKDLQGQVFAVSPKCPHLGCRLVWNQEELSWDCPCHGSRFDYRGVLLDGPALGNITTQLP